MPSSILLAYNKINLSAALALISESLLPIGPSLLIVDSSIYSLAQESTKAYGNIYILSHSKLLYLALIFLSSIVKLNIYVPHSKNGKILRMLLNTASLISIIDDGLDSYRSKPRNLCLDKLCQDITLYLFDLGIPYAMWTQGFLVHKLNKKYLHLGNPQLLCPCTMPVFIESPALGVPDYLPSSAIVFRHPNRRKRLHWPKAYTLIESTDSAIETEIKCFNSSTPIYIGESFTLFYLASYDHNYKVYATITAEFLADVYQACESLDKSVNLRIVD